MSAQLESAKARSAVVLVLVLSRASLSSTQNTTNALGNGQD